jgi:pimeloyl-ACP methyl ester carboxylesterase
MHLLAPIVASVSALYTFSEMNFLLQRLPRFFRSAGCAFSRPFRGFAAAALLLLCAGCVHTQPFKDAKGHIIPGSIAVMENLPIGGILQSVWLRSTSRSNPALVLLHGGPGASESALFRHFNSELEQHFLVVYWEQRGTGRSYHADIPPHSMTIDQFVRDLDELVDWIRQRFGKDKVVLLGHSWGTVPGTIYAYRHPEKVAAYVGVAQIADAPKSRRMSWEFAMAEARKHGNAKAVSQLQAVGPPPYSSVDEQLAAGKWVEHFGGVFHQGLSTGKLISAALGTDEANLMDLVRFGQGNRFSLVSLEAEISRLNLSADYRSFRVPVFFLLGRYDMNTPAILAKLYFQTIEAPRKQLIWFEKSAHNPPFEEPEKFNRVLIEHVLPLTHP